MYPIKINQKRLNLNLFSQAKINELLRTAQDTQATVTCLCHEGRGLLPPPAPLRLTPVRGVPDYHLRRNSSDAGSHHEDCRHTRLTLNRLATYGLTEKALRIDDEGGMHINLDFGIADNDTREKSPTVGQHKHSTGRVTETRSRASLLGLLHLMWAQANLNFFDPDLSEAVHEPFERLRQVARRTYPDRMNSLKNHGLSGILLLPHDTAPNQANRNYAKLCEANGRRRVMFVCKLNPELLHNRNGGGYANLHGQFGVRVSIHGDVIDLMLTQYPTERAALNVGAEVIAFGVAKVSEYQPGRMAATVERIALMGVSESYLPVESSHERELAQRLEQRGRIFVKPLRHDTSEPTRPDFILLDTPRPVSLEVYGMNTPEYLQRKAEKQAYYAAEFAGRYWQWDVLSESLEVALCRLPQPATLVD